MHDVFTVGVPLLAILAGVLFSRNDVKELRAEMNIRFGEMNNCFNKVEDHLGRIDADLRQFYHLTGKLEARMDALDKRSFNADPALKAEVLTVNDRRCDTLKIHASPCHPPLAVRVHLGTTSGGLLPPHA